MKILKMVRLILLMNVNKGENKILDSVEIEVRDECPICGSYNIKDEITEDFWILSICQNCGSIIK